MLVKIIGKVEDSIFLSSLEEVSKINWEIIDIEDRSRNYIFSTSRSISLRVPKITDVRPTSVLDWGTILDCIDHQQNKLRYPACYRAVEWILTQVNGISLGRVMIVNLLPGGIVAPHIDSGIYFSKYSRFHIPLITNEQVVFSRGKNATEEHMPCGHLCQLNNLDMHMVKNNTDYHRIHIIADIEIRGGNYVF